MAKAKAKAPKSKGPDDPYDRLNKGIPQKEPPKPEVKEPKTEGPRTATDDDLIKNMLRTNREIGNIETRKDADPLHIKALNLFLKLHAGGMINPYAPTANQEVEQIIKDLTKAVSKE